MTDPDLADATYIEPITPEIVAKIIEKERPDALLPTMGGQTALNTALSLRRMGVLDKFDVEMIGATAEAIDKAEDRELFREAMKKIGLETPKSFLANASDLKQAGSRQVCAGAERDRGAPPSRETEKARRAPPSSATGPASEQERKKRYVVTRARRGAAGARRDRPARHHPSLVHARRHRRRHRLQPRRVHRASSIAASTPRRPTRC